MLAKIKEKIKRACLVYVLPFNFRDVGEGRGGLRECACLCTYMSPCRVHADTIRSPVLNVAKKHLAKTTFIKKKR